MIEQIIFKESLFKNINSFAEDLSEFSSYNNNWIICDYDLMSRKISMTDPIWFDHSSNVNEKFLQSILLVYQRFPMKWYDMT